MSPNLKTSSAHAGQDNGRLELLCIYICISAGVAACPNSEANADYATPGWLLLLISGTGAPLAISISSRRGQGQHRAGHRILLAAYILSVPPAIHAYLQPVSDPRQDKTEGHTGRGDARLQSSRAAPGPGLLRWDHDMFYRGREGQNVRVPTKGVHPLDIGATGPEMHVSVHFFYVFLAQCLWHLFRCLPSDDRSTNSVGAWNGCDKIRYPPCRQITPQHHGFWLPSHAVVDRLCL